jgi:AbrB family looped-hinge helix DNA binding protein
MRKIGDAAMPLVKIKDKGQVTLPAKTRERYGLDVGDYVEVIEEGDSIRLVPQEIAPRHPAVDATLDEAIEDERALRVSPAFKNTSEYRAWQKKPEGRKFSSNS